MRRPEPWYRLVEVVVIPPLAAWFSWRFEGLEHVPRRGPVLVAANHVSYFDPFAHGRFLEKARRRPRFLAKAELYGNAFLRTVLTGTGQIPVRRGSGDRAPVDAAMEALGNGQAVLVYPEGTVTHNADYSPMQGKTGVARLALGARVPVLPLAVWGSQRVWQRDGMGSLKFARPIWVRAGAPLDFSDRYEAADDRTVHRAVTDEVMTEISGLVEDMRARYPKQWA